MGTTESQTFEAGDVKLQSGITSRGTRLVYKTWGRLTAERSNAVPWLTPVWSKNQKHLP